MGFNTAERRPRGSKAVGDSLGTVVTWFMAAFLLLTALPLAPAVSEMTQLLSRNETSEVSVGALAVLITPSIAALTIPLALLLGLTVGMGWSTNESEGLHKSPRLVRIVTAFVLPVCLLEGALLFGIVPVANDRFRNVLFAGMVGRESALASLPKGVREMSLTELRRVAASQPGPNYSHRSATFELHKRASIPVAGLFLAFLGMALGASRRYRRPSVNLMLAGAAGVLWYALLELGASMVPTAQIPSWFGAWFPAIAACFLAMLAWWRYGARHADA